MELGLSQNNSHQNGISGPIFGVCKEQNCSRCIKSIIEHIPQSNQEAITIKSLSEETKVQCGDCVRAVLRLLQLFDAVNIFPEYNDENTKVKAKTQTAW